MRALQYLYSALPKEKYLTAMKARFCNPLLLFDERITGFTVGSFFVVSHYQEWEWNRKITGECNRAYGFVKEVEGELEISFIRSRGLFSPSWILLLTLLCKLIFTIYSLRGAYDLGTADWTMSIIISLIFCGASAVDVGLTENGQAGRWKVDQFLQNPEEYYI